MLPGANSISRRHRADDSKGCCSCVTKYGKLLPDPVWDRSTWGKPSIRHTLRAHRGPCGAMRVQGAVCEELQLRAHVSEPPGSRALQLQPASSLWPWGP